jgi:hypothetical protein
MKQRRLNRVARTLRIVTVLLGVSLLAGCDRNVRNMLPHDVEGTWTTDDPRYGGRFFELSPTFLIVVAGRDVPASVQWIDKVKVQGMGAETSYMVYSTDYADDSQNQMVLVFSPANGGEIRFRNRAEVWHREWR